MPDGKKADDFIQFAEDQQTADLEAAKVWHVSEAVLTCCKACRPDSAFQAKLWSFGVLLQAHRRAQMVKEYGAVNARSGIDTLEIQFSAWHVKISEGRKYINVDVGGSGVFMVTKEDGEIFGIKGYGVIHKGHQYGTLDTVGAWYWGLYRGVRFNEPKTIEPAFRFESFRPESVEPTEIPKPDTIPHNGRGRVPISARVAEILRNSEISGNALRLTAQLDRATYQEVNKVLNILGGRWNRGKGCHVFSEPVADVLTSALDAGQVVDSKKAMAQFYTPADIAARVVDLACIEPGMCVLEPSGGRGALIAEVVKRIDTEILTYEIDAENCRHMEKRFPSYRVQVRQADFLTVNAFSGCYPRVIMNPPFTNGADIKHIRHALRMLKTPGRLVAICSNGPRQREAFEALASCWEVLPAGSFKAEGTQVETALIVLEV